MANVFIIGKKGSRSRLAIAKNTSVKLYKGQKADAIVNYGLPGMKLRQSLRKYPSANNVPIINKYVGVSKLIAVQEAHKAGIIVPESKIALSRTNNADEWIEKRIHSSQGNGICAARGRNRITGKYYQKMIFDRRFELRVHAFLWVPQDNWTLSKREGPSDQIAWNYHQGGYFSTVRRPNSYRVFMEAKRISEEILKIRDMSFGAVDLIVDNTMKIYFIEVNASPGFTELNQSVYFDAMTQLASLSVKKVSNLGR